jgi:hypothetical protein
MMVAHILGIPVEESVLQLAPAGVATVTWVAIAGRASLGRLRRRRRDRAGEEAIASQTVPERDDRRPLECS